MGATCVGPTHRSIEHAIERIGRCDRSAQRPRTASRSAYGVIAVADPIEDLLGPNLPILTRAVLLPFKGKIIYDGLLVSYRVSFGPGTRKRLNATYRHAKEVNGVITSLPLKK